MTTTPPDLTPQPPASLSVRGDSSTQPVDASQRNGAAKPGPLGKWRQRAQDAQRKRRDYEKDWRLCHEYVANNQWVGWSREERRVIDLRTLADEKEREHFTSNVLTQYLWTMFGKLYGDDYKCNISLRVDDETGREYAQQAQRAWDLGWDEEWDGDRFMYEVLLGICTYGTVGGQVYLDPRQGKPVGPMPLDPTGRPVLDNPQAFVAEMMRQGQTAPIRDVREGRICWQDLNPFNILPPPGVRRERDFPWLILCRPASIDAELRPLYGDKAKGLAENPLDGADFGGISAGQDNDRKIKGHALVYTGFEYPTPESPQGQQIVWAGDRVLEAPRDLDIQVNGEPKFGVFFYHFRRLKQRFWSQGIVEPQLGGQRQRNRLRSQQVEIVDRVGLPKIFAERGTITVSKLPGGRVGEIITYPRTANRPPTEFVGTGPGPWLEGLINSVDADLDKIAGLHDVSLGQAPGNTSAYAAMALLKEEDDRRQGPVLKEIRRELSEQAKYTLQAMRKWWPTDKQFEIAGADHVSEAFTFNATLLPMSQLVKVGKDTPAPTSQAASLQLIFDLWDRFQQAGQPLPGQWLYDSVSAGYPLPPPTDVTNVQRKNAQLENARMLEGNPVQVEPFDMDVIHISVHRAQQVEIAQVPQYEQANELIEQHVRIHVMAAQAKAGAAAAAQQVPQLQGGMGQAGQAPAGPAFGNALGQGPAGQNVSAAPPPPGQ